VLAAAIAAALAGLSHFPYEADAGDRAVVRLSWRARGARVERCRRLTEAEQEQLPRHMRRSEICEGRLAPYELRLRLDGDTVLVDTVRGSGARGDRPIYVFAELSVLPGLHSLEVSFRRLGAGTAKTAAPVAVPPEMSLAASIELSAGDVALVTYDPERRALVLRRGEG
jgi:hypothetical protein